jgi:hypothetical protein
VLNRQLSYDGAQFELSTVRLSPKFQVQYARAAALWQALHYIAFLTEVFDKRRNKKGGSMSVGSAFWGSQQRFFKSMIMAAKVPQLAREAQEAIMHGFAVVIGLQSTGEANQKKQCEENGECPCFHVIAFLICIFSVFTWTWRRRLAMGFKIEKRKFVLPDQSCPFCIRILVYLPSTITGLPTIAVHQCMTLARTT